MKSTIACLALFALGLVSFSSVNAPGIPIGAAIPKADVRVKDVSGKELTLQEAKQTNGLLVMFTCNCTPECYLFDKCGKLVYHGAIDDSPGDAGQVKRHHLKEAIGEMMQGKEVTVKETRSVGCSINRG